MTTKEEILIVIGSVAIVAIVFLVIGFVDSVRKFAIGVQEIGRELQIEDERNKALVKMYANEMEEGYCVEGTEYLYSEDLGQGIDVIVFKKCEVID